MVFLGLRLVGSRRSSPRLAPTNPIFRRASRGRPTQGGGELGLQLTPKGAPLPPPNLILPLRGRRGKISSEGSCPPLSWALLPQQGQRAYWPSFPTEREGDRAESLYSVEEERDDSFTAVLDFIRHSHDLEKPAGVAPSRGKMGVTRKLGLQAEPTPALNLPPSPLVAALVDDVNSIPAKFVEEQTPNSFIPLPLKRQRRYYHISEPTFPGPYAVPPGLVSLTLDKTSEPKKRLVLIPHSLVSSFETALSGASEATSWFDWWLSTMSTFSESLPDEARVDFDRLIVSGSKALEFLGSQAIAALGNLVLLRRDSLLTDVRSTVPVEELSRLRHATLPTSVALFPLNLLDTALSKTRSSTRRFTHLRSREDQPRGRAGRRRPRLLLRTAQAPRPWLKVKGH